MNEIIFSERLRECRKLKYSSQQLFADAYMEKFGMIRKGKKDDENNMFGTIQSWEQGKSFPRADVLSNICDLLECDADYLLGRINHPTHDLETSHRYTGLSQQALEQLHFFRNVLSHEPNWEEIRNLDENWSSHEYYRAFSLYLIDELLVGSKSHKLSAGIIDRLFTMIYEEGIGADKKDYLDPNDDNSISEKEAEILAAQTREQIDIVTYLITTNIRDILFENTILEKLPNALRLDDSKGTYFFSIYE